MAYTKTSRYGFAAFTVYVAVTSAAATSVPPTVVEVAEGFLAECRDIGDSEPRPSNQFIRTAYFNQDGQPDFIIDTAEMNCEGAYSLFCGSAGCAIAILVSSGNDWKNAFEGNVRSWDVVQRGDEQLLLIGLHGSACGRVGAESCEKLLSYADGQFVERQ